MISLSKFCDEHKLPKTSVKRWLNDQGFDTANGLTADAVEALKQQYSIADPEPVQVEVLTGELIPVRSYSLSQVDASALHEVADINQQRMFGNVAAFLRGQTAELERLAYVEGSNARQRMGQAYAAGVEGMAFGQMPVNQPVQPGK